MGTLASGSIDLKSLKVAGEGASKYITDIGSDGIKVHDATSTASSNFIKINSNGMKIYQGGDAETNVVANFSTITTIGKVNQSHLEMDYHSLQMIDKDENFTFCLKDLRDTTGEATLRQDYEVFGLYPKCKLGATSKDTNYSVYDSKTGNELSANKYTDYFEVLEQFQTTTAIYVIYTTSDAKAESLSFGILNTDLNKEQGPLSGSFGYRVLATGAGAYALGYAEKNTDYGKLSGRVEAGGIGALASGFSQACDTYSSDPIWEGIMAKGNGSFAFGVTNGGYIRASGDGSLAGGVAELRQVGDDLFIEDTITSAARGSMAHGYGTVIAGGLASHALGYHVQTDNVGQLAIGSYNETDGQYIFMVGYGSSETNRRNVFRVDLDGYVYTAKDIDTSTVSDFFTVNSTNATISNARYIRRGNVVQLFITWTNKSAISVPASGNITNILVGTLLTDKRPLITTAAHSIGDNSGQCWYRVDTDGTIDLSAVESTGAARTIAKDSIFQISCTYIVE